jgi:hypothetical protein
MSDLKTRINIGGLWETLHEDFRNLKRLEKSSNIEGNLMETINPIKDSINLKVAKRCIFGK